MPGGVTRTTRTDEKNGGGRGGMGTGNGWEGGGRGTVRGTGPVQIRCGGTGYNAGAQG